VVMILRLFQAAKLGGRALLAPVVQPKWMRLTFISQRGRLRMATNRPFHFWIDVMPMRDRALVTVLGLGMALHDKQDWDGAIAESREALRLDPNEAWAHAVMGMALGGGKGDWQAAVTEERAALRLNPNDDTAHCALGVALEATQNREEALQEYRAARELKPESESYREAYERLAKGANP
jgi:tetratricopeptide (TPR) repeat protein